MKKQLLIFGLNRTENGTVSAEKEWRFSVTYRQLVREKALDQHGLITTRTAMEVKVPAVELRKLAQRGALKNLGYGLYRLKEARPGELDQYAEAIYRVGPMAYLMGESVLTIYNLALVNPKKIKVLTSRRIRRRLPEFIEVIQGRLDPDEITNIEGIPATTVARALRDCRESIMPSRFAEALKKAQEQGLITAGEAKSFKQANRRKL